MLKRFLTLLLPLSLGLSAGARTPELADIYKALSAPTPYSAEADFTVTMPQMPDDVIYTVVLSQKAGTADRLAPCDYLIEWELTGRDEPVKGFSAYFDGHHYRYSGQKLQEYHMEWDSIPFRPSILGGMQGAGVQRTAQFTDLLPAFLSENLKRMASDNRYRITLHPDTMVSGKKRVVVDAEMTINGSTAQECEYVLDSESLLPVSSKLENNPGSISEQTIYVTYKPRQARDGAINEAMLMELYPEPFERYRTSNFRVENLRGAKLPAFAVPTTTGERYSRNASDAFRAPTILALMNSEQSLSADMIKALRSAVDALPFGADLIMAFADSHIDGIEQAAGELREGEHLLMSARGLARDCGAASLPTVLLVNKDGTVADVIIGYNNDIASDVIQKMTFIKP